MRIESSVGFSRAILKSSEKIKNSASLRLKSGEELRAGNVHAYLYLPFLKILGATARTVYDTNRSLYPNLVWLKLA